MGQLLLLHSYCVLIANCPVVDFGDVGVPYECQRLQTVFLGLHLADADVVAAVVVAAVVVAVVVVASVVVVADVVAAVVVVGLWELELLRHPCIAARPTKVDSASSMVLAGDKASSTMSISVVPKILCLAAAVCSHLVNQCSVSSTSPD